MQKEKFDQVTLSLPVEIRDTIYKMAKDEMRPVSNLVAKLIIQRMRDTNISQEHQAPAEVNPTSE